MKTNGMILGSIFGLMVASSAQAWEFRQLTPREFAVAKAIFKVSDHALCDAIEGWYRPEELEVSCSESRENIKPDYRTKCFGSVVLHKGDLSIWPGRPSFFETDAPDGLLHCQDYWIDPTPVGTVDG